MASKKKTKKKSENESLQSKREVTGIFIIALGLFFCVSLYSDAAGIVGSTIGEFFFGLTGLVGYALPVIVLIAGIAMIITSNSKQQGSVYLLSFVGLLCILVVMHVALSRVKPTNIGVIDYYSDAYAFGRDQRDGGGLLGSLLAYPSLIWLGEVGSYIFFIAGAIIVFLLITKISLKSAGEKVGQGIKEGYDNVVELIERRNELYAVDLAAEEENAGRVKRGRRGRVEPEDESGSIHIGEMRKLKYTEDELSLLPQKGAIERKRDIVLDEDFEFDDIDQPKEIKLPAEHERVSHISNLAPEAPAAPAVPAAKPPRKAPEVKKEAEMPLASDAGIAQYQRPPLNLLNTPPKRRSGGADSPEAKGRLLVDTLKSFNIEAKILDISVGPAITRFELQPAQGVRVSRITTLSNDIALALAAPRVRIEAPIPGKAAIGIEIPNVNVESVLLREIIEAKAFQSAPSAIAFALGKDIAGGVAFTDLDKMPHLLIAGSTGSGKSVCINDVILSMVYKSSPADVRMILIDPKVVELKVFSVLPHLLLPVVTDPKKAAGALKWAVLQMEQRYQLMSKFNARDLARYNSLQKNEEDRLPKLVIIIDELADLMMVASKDVEESICRIAQLGRAAGIHLIVATQRPSTDIITGLIKANIPSRIAFMVSSSVDSRVILDSTGAEKLLGRGDMLFHANGANKPVRIQGAFVSDEEVERVMDFFSELKVGPEFSDTSLDEMGVTSTMGGAQGNGKQEDELLGEAVRIVLESGQASISMVQRRLRVGYARAARLIDIMEQMSIVSGFDGSKPRKLLIDESDYERMFGGASEE